MKIRFEVKGKPVLAHVFGVGVPLEGFTPLSGVKQEALVTLSAYLRGPVLTDDHASHAQRRRLNTMMHQTNPIIGQLFEQNRMRFAAFYSLGFIKFCYDDTLLQNRPDLSVAIDNLIAALPESAEKWDKYDLVEKLEKVEEITRRAKLVFDLSVVR